MKLVVGFDDSILKQSAKGGKNPLFTLYWTQGQQDYPEKQWVDSGSVVLGWWLVSARTLLEGRTEVDFPFMEGPFGLTIRRLGNQVTVTNTEQTWTAKTLLSPFISELLTATSEVISKFAELGIKDTSGLEPGMRQLQITFSKANNASSVRPAAATSISH